MPYTMLASISPVRNSRRNTFRVLLHVHVPRRDEGRNLTAAHDPPTLKISRFRVDVALEIRWWRLDRGEDHEHDRDQTRN